MDPVAAAQPGRIKGLVLVAVAVALSGCFSPPDVPDDAVLATSEDMPGVVMHVWSDERAGRIRLHAVVENTGDEAFKIRDGCGHPWNSTITDAAGRHVEFREFQEAPGCAAFYDDLRPGAWKDILYSWDGQDHDPANATAEPVPSGNYTWTLQFRLRDDVRYLEAALPISV